ncbi:MAG: N-acetyl sugar amidotransferase [Phycisphaerae bacterium]|nr:N-acetyl sugar amidotransferase [Phycisphaerae bacterium]
MIDYTVTRPLPLPGSKGERVCTRTVMDASIPGVSFDAEGVCNFARRAEWRLTHERFHGAERDERLGVWLSRMKQAGKGRPYDCLIGLSGGVDSSFVAMKVVELGLRPLAVHLDNGWNSELAVSNIEKIVRSLGIDLYTHVIDWEEFKDLQRCYFRASVIDLECVSDHAINTILPRIANRHRIGHLIIGTNVTSESILPPKWGYDKRDGRNLISIHRKFGTVRLNSYPYMLPAKLFYYLFIRRLMTVPILNYLDYNKTAALQGLAEKLQWRPYPRKHGENRFTRFFQEYYLPTKFGVDKRRAHFSSLIVAGEMTRDEAFERLKQPLYTEEELREEFEYVAKKLDWSVDELAAVIAQPPKQHTDYGNAAWMFDHNSRLVQLARYVAKGEFSFSRIKAVWKAPLESAH